MRLLFWSSEECGVTPSLPLFSGPLKPGEIVVVKVPSMIQIDLFEINGVFIGLE